MFALYRIEKLIYWAMVWNGESWDDNPLNAKLYDLYDDTNDERCNHSSEDGKFVYSIQHIPSLLQRTNHGPQDHDHHDDRQ